MRRHRDLVRTDSPLVRRLGSGGRAIGGMRAAALSKRLPRQVAMVAGDGQAIPLRDSSCRAAWLCTVIHHIPNLDACAAALRRVLRTGAPVLIRSSFPDRHEEIPLFSFFPGAKLVAETFPTVEMTEASFATAGFRLELVRRVHEHRDADMTSAVERVRALRQSDSTLPLSDDEFAAGLAAMKKAAAAGAGLPPTGLDVLVLRGGTRIETHLTTS
jgi:Methyltransferase domain